MFLFKFLGNIKYNIFSSIKIFLDTFNFLLIINIFGASSKSDIYFFSISILQSLQLVQLMFVEQFMYFYNDLKIYSKEKAYNFLSVSLLYSLLIGFLFFFIFTASSNLVILLFVKHMSLSSKIILKDVLQILFFSLIFFPNNYIIRLLLNAELKLFYYYIILIIPSFFTFLTLIFEKFFNFPNLKFLACARTISSVIIFFIGLWIISTNFSLYFKPKKDVILILKKFIKNSFFMRLGHNLHNLLSTIITNSILSFFPPGYASYFFYSDKILQMIITVSVEPYYLTLRAKLSLEYSRDKINNMVTHIKKFYKNSFLIFFVLFIITFVTLPFIFKFFGKNLKINLLSQMLALMFLWSFIKFIESPFVLICIISKHSRIIIFCNLVFISIYYLISSELIKYMKVYAVPVSLILAQLFNFSLYFNFARKLLSRRKYSELSQS